MVNLLVIEDDKNLAELLHVLFAHKGYSVTCAENVPKAKACIGREGTTHFDIILADFLLNGTSSETLVELIRERASRARIVMMSADIAAMRKSMKSLFERNMIDAVIAKPCDFDVLLNLVEDLSTPL